MLDEGRRGTRSRVTEHSRSDAPVSDEGARSDEGSPQSGEGESQESQKGGTRARTGDHPERTAKESQAASQEQGDDQQGGDPEPTRRSSFDHSTDEAAEWERVRKDNAELRKGKAHADRKITEQGQELSQANEESQQLGDRLGRLEGSVAQLVQTLSGQNGAGTNRVMNASYGNDRGFEEDNEQPGGTRNEPSDDGLRGEVDQVKNVLGGIYGQMQDHTEKFTAFQQAQSDEKEISHLQTQLGVNREAAETIMETYKSGDVANLAKVLELSTIPAEARRTAREQRQQQRNSVFQPAMNTGGPAYNPNQQDESVMKDKAEKIMEMPDGRNKQRAMDKFLDTYPEAYEHVKQASGYNI